MAALRDIPTTCKATHPRRWTETAAAKLTLKRLPLFRLRHLKIFADTITLLRRQVLESIRQWAGDIRPFLRSQTGAVFRSAKSPTGNLILLAALTVAKFTLKLFALLLQTLLNIPKNAIALFRCQILKHLSSGAEGGKAFARARAGATFLGERHRNQ